MNKGQKLQVSGQMVIIDAIERSKFGRVAYFRSEGIYQWEYVAVLTNGKEK